jgi:microcystin-dependent protein
MAKTKISEYSATPADNTDISNINIAEGCSPANVNNAIRGLMAQLKDQQAGTSGDPFTVSGALTASGTLTSSGTLAITGGLTLDGAAGTSGQVMVSAGSGTPTWGNAFVAGMIMLWSGSSATIPSGWLLCDGSSSTPDLRNRFVVGATSTYAVGATGGSADAIVVSHTHTATVTDPGHTHPFRTGGGGPPYDQVSISSQDQYDVGTSTRSAVTGITVANSTTGASGTNANLPPYYALCYIMKA